MHRLRAWLAVAPLLVIGMCAAHAAAYRVTRTPGAELHAYLEHAPQLVLLLTILGLALAPIGDRLRIPPAWSFAAVAPLGFVVQEHLERVAHSGELAWLPASPVFLVGLALQVPVAVLAWAVARLLLRALGAPCVRPQRVQHALGDLVAPVSHLVAPLPARVLSGRGPPTVLRP